MVKDKHLERIKAIKRISRIETGGPHGKAGTHADKSERRTRRLRTQDWLEEVEEENVSMDEHVICYFCGNEVEVKAAHLHQDKWIGDCCWDERLKTTE